MEIKDIKNWQYEELSDQEAEAVSGGQSSKLLSLHQSSESLSLQLAVRDVGAVDVGVVTDGCNPGHEGGGGPHGLVTPA